MSRQIAQPSGHYELAPDEALALHLHEFLNELAADKVFEPVTTGAWTHARAKLRHTAFIELNQTTVLPCIYGPESEARLRRWRGHRLLGVDSSLLRLPRSREMLEEFGAVEVRNHLGATGTTYAEGRMSVLYDLLNRVALDGRLESSRVGEVELAIEQLRQARLGDVLVNDRGFTGYAYLAWHHRLALDYVARCSTGSFAAAQELFRMNRAGRSKTVRLLAPADQSRNANGSVLSIDTKYCLRLSRATCLENYGSNMKEVKGREVKGREVKGSHLTIQQLTAQAWG
jgi:Transposase DDE domain